MSAPSAEGAVSAGRVERPVDLAEARDLMQDTAGSLLFRGAGTKQQWGGRVDDPDVVVDTTAMSGVLTYNPADLTASVLAGTPLAELQDHVAEHGQWLAVDPPSAEQGATIGGLLAAGDSGPARLRYGGIRDLVIGTTLVLSDGAVARAGGHVIKNVAGYDLTKVMNGSLGALGLVAEVVVRLHPRSSTTRTVTAQADADAATAVTLALAAGPLEPTAIDWLSAGPDAPGRLLVRSDGAGGPVGTSCDQVVRVLAEHGLEGRVLDAEEAAEAWRAHHDGVRAGEEDTVMRVSGRPSELAGLDAVLQARAEGAGVTARVLSRTGVGLHTVHLRGGGAPAHAEVVRAVREHAGPLGSAVLLQERPRSLDEHVDALGPPPSSVALLRRVKEQLDPDARCAPGRFAGWF